MRIYHRSKFYLGKAIFRAWIFAFIYMRKLHLNGLVLLGKNSALFCKSGGEIVVGNRCYFFDNVEVQSRGLLSFGNNVQVNNFSRIVALERVTIGDNVTIAQFVTILDHDHKYIMDRDEMKLDGFETTPVNIGDNVWIGDKATVLRGVSIGNNVIIAANAVVNCDIPDNCIAGGVPARVLKTV